MNSRPALAPAPFLTTRWTRVCLAKADSEDGRRALAELCAAYYEPVVAFLRSEMRESDAARELSHAFFAEILAGASLCAADPARGRFRSYLLGALKHFLSHQREAAHRIKRGQGVAPLALEDESVGALPDAHQVSPDAAFDRQWALTVLARAIETLREECVAAGQGDFFEKAKPWLVGEGTHGGQTALAAESGLSPAALKMAVHRLKRRFRQCVKAEVVGTLEDPAFVEEEMRSLFAALGG
jgi:RNA polymerase sigma-70 factor (ECF subfamily)